MDTSYLATSYSYEDKDYFEQSVAVLPTPCGFQQPQHGHLYPIVPTSIHPVQGSTHLTGNDHYDHSIAIQPSMFYYAAAAAAGPSLSASQEEAPSNLQNKTMIDGLNDGNSQGARKRGTKRGRPTKNPVWTFFRRIDDKSVQCNMCARLVKSACATNMSKHLERHHQNATTVTTPSPVDQVDFNAQKYDQSVVSNYDVHQAPSWNSYSQHMQPLKHVLFYCIPGIKSSHQLRSLSQYAGATAALTRSAMESGPSRCQKKSSYKASGLGAISSDDRWQCTMYSVQRCGAISVFE